MRKYDGSFRLLYDIGNRKESSRRGGLNKTGKKKGKSVSIEKLKFQEKKNGNGDKRA